MQRKLATATAAFAILLAGCGLVAMSAVAQPATDAGVEATQNNVMQDLLSYLEKQNTTGFIVMRGGKVIAEENWPAPQIPLFKIFLYGKTDSGALLEDVASQQKSFISVLVGTAIDKGLIDVDKPVSEYIGAGWSKATPEQEQAIKVINILNMNSGLDEKFGFEAPSGTKFFYNTPVYAFSKRILTAATGLELEQLTHDWLTEPVGMKDTAWRQRPAALANVGNNTGLVTSPRDTALFGQMILQGGVAEDGTRIISEASLKAMFERSATNPAYGRLWWLNGSDYVLAAQDKRREGPLVPAAPADMVAALGFLDRRLYVVPSLDMVVVRTGADAPDADFDEQVWERLMRAIP
ncbi:MAG: class C beta-lactamase-related serine hydrolase [Alphaproteobacteria bacterium]|nr:MAG: class C beta-lactamase-related serine hydrolase [Alphaproteobacteria bacterium]